jgi:phosphoribosylglycinamide formyltransferase-1
MRAIVAAIDRGDLDATVAVVLSNREHAPGLAHARAAGISAEFVDPKSVGSREAYDAALVQRLRAHDVALVCLAGYMRLVGKPLLDAFSHRILNIHPSLLPSFPGLDAQRQALVHGVRITGATVHLVTEELDGGPIILQSAVSVLPDDSPETLAARILVEEHRIYPEAIRLVLEGGWTIEGRRFVNSSA